MDNEELIEKLRQLTVKYNELSDAFIQLSLAFAPVSQYLHDCEQPTLFTSNTSSDDI